MASIEPAGAATSDGVGVLMSTRGPDSAVPPGLDHVEATFLAGSGAPSSARSAVTMWLQGLVSESVLGDVRLLVSELVTNSCRHAGAEAGAPVNLRVSLRNGRLRLEVDDLGSNVGIARRSPDLDAGGGFGLGLVDSLSAEWGSESGTGTRVWLELVV